MRIIDLNSNPLQSHTRASVRAEMADEFRKDRVLPALPHPARFRILRHTSQEKLPLPTPLFPPSQQIHRPSLRSNCYALWLLCPKGLSRKTAPRPFLRCANQQGFGFPDQQLYPTTPDHRPTVSMPLAGGVVLQVDQATPSHQGGLLWYQRQCHQNANLDCYLDLSVSGHRQKTLEPQLQLVLDSTDFKRHHLRENSNLARRLQSYPQLWITCLASHSRKKEQMSMTNVHRCHIFSGGFHRFI